MKESSTCVKNTNYLLGECQFESTFTLHTNFPADAGPPAAPDTPCCMCNCKGTLQAILREMRAMRRLMQIKKGPTTIPHTLT